MTDIDTQAWIAVNPDTGEIITDSTPARVMVTHQQLFEALAQGCKMLPETRPDGTYNWSMMTRTERGMLNRASKELREAGRTVADIEYFCLTWFPKNDWRGKRGDPPLPTDVVKMITRSLTAKASTSNGVAQEWLKTINR